MATEEQGSAQPFLPRWVRDSMGSIHSPVALCPVPCDTGADYNEAEVLNSLCFIYSTSSTETNKWKKYPYCKYITRSDIEMDTNNHVCAFGKFIKLRKVGLCKRNVQAVPGSSSQLFIDWSGLQGMTGSPSC